MGNLPMPLLRILAGVAIAFGLDRLSKISIVHWLDLGSAGVIEVAPPYLVLRMTWNKGINFGVLSLHDSQWVLVVSAVVISLVLMAWTRNRQGWLQPLAVGLVVGGALGNALDRVIYGAVADYLNMSCCGIRNPFAFNVADVFIFGGILLLIVGGRTESRPVLPGQRD
jgi:signal peptidase II